MEHAAISFGSLSVILGAAEYHAVWVPARVGVKGTIGKIPQKKRPPPLLPLMGILEAAFFVFGRVSVANRNIGIASGPGRGTKWYFSHVESQSSQRCIL
jgi:hypothetical protein